MTSHVERALLVALWCCLVTMASCDFDLGTRWIPTAPPPVQQPICAIGERRCGNLSALEECQDTADGANWVLVDDCGAKGLVCAPSFLECRECIPDDYFCDGQDVKLCASDGWSSSYYMTCDTSVGQACRDGSCPQLCDVAQQEKSNVGCEYWAVDLDNAMIDVTRNAAAQQYAVVVSNPQPDVPVAVQILQDDGNPGDAPAPYQVAEAVIPPLNLRVFKLGPREVDGSPEGEFNTGTHTAWTRHAYQVVTDFPVVAYQFNPLENVNVFSNDATLLKPREALTFDYTQTALAYVVAAWPQTIAITDDPNTNFSSQSPVNLRAFLTIVGTSDDTEVVIKPSTDVLGGGGIAAVQKGGELTLHIDAFDVLNLETPSMNSFNADFTGSLVESDKPIAVFVGSEASDAPHFPDLTERRCCADHLEEQLDPVRTAGKLFAFAHSPSRTEVVSAAGAEVGIAPEPEFFRFVSTSAQATTIHTTLPPPDDKLQLFHLGEWTEVSTTRDFLAESDRPIHVVQVMASQDAANIPRLLPGGDPSIVVVPPREQFRHDYVFLTPDKYAFDFITVVTSVNAVVTLDGGKLDDTVCDVRPTDGLTDDERGGKPVEFLTYSCQLSFAVVDPDYGTVTPGMQNDGVHRLVSSEPAGVLAFGFDAYVSYGYAAGTELREIAVPE